MSRAMRSVRSFLSGRFAATVITLPFSSIALPAQVMGRADRLPAPTARVELDGPRFGMTLLSSGVRAKLAERDIDVGGAVSQFGWQFERQFIGVGDGVAPVTELVLLVGGLDQGTFLPSVSWLVGLRSARGTEFGVGPNVTPAGTALAFAAGITLRQESVHIPINLAVVPSKSGTRVSLLTGWTMR